jgi:hypothetical protein
MPGSTSGPGPGQTPDPGPGQTLVPGPVADLNTTAELTLDSTLTSEGITLQGSEIEVPRQTEKYLRVVNKTSKTITVSVRLTRDSTPLTWSVSAGEEADLSNSDGKRIVCRAAFIWAESEGRRWLTYKDVPLTVVPRPYVSPEVLPYPVGFE